MSTVPPNQQPADREASRHPPGSPLARPLGEGPAGPGGSSLHQPRVKMIETSGDFSPVGASYTPPTAAPLPERGAGLHLLLSVLAATIAVVFLVLLLHKL